jgi:L-arabinokinase
VAPGTVYSVRACTRHPVHEHFRVERFRDLLLVLARVRSRLDRMNVLLQMGDLMVQSHASYGACGLGEPVTDALVEEVRKAGPDAGVYGAKITGGGSGGTVCVLAEGRKGLGTVRRIAERVLGRRQVFLALGSSEGAAWS